MALTNNSANITNSTCLVVTFGLSSYDAPMSAVAIALIIVILFGNTLTLTAIWKTKELQTTTNKFVSSLAVSDLLVAIAMIFNVVYSTVNLTESVSKPTLCLIVYMLFQLSLVMSVLNLHVISMERYIYICHPLYYNLWITPKKAHIGIAMSWALIFIFVVYFSMQTTGDCSKCETMVSTILSHCFLTISFIFIIFCYGSIVKAALEQRKRIHASRVHKKSKTGSDMKLIKLMGSVVGVFAICWLPHNFITAVDAITGSHITHQYGRYINVVAIANSGMNFFIYAVKDTTFRLAFIKILRHWK